LSINAGIFAMRTGDEVQVAAKTIPPSLGPPEQSAAATTII
jgi:hypothetical protein